MSAASVGIVANPVSARDIRRIVSHAGSLQIADRANIVLRILVGLAAAGIGRVVMMPENAGIRSHLQRAMARAARAGGPKLPALDFLDMPVEGAAIDSVTATRLMRAMAVAAIVVLGGDGTHRIVVRECGDIAIASMSTGTNNAFPKTAEPTIIGLATGLAVTGVVPAAAAFCHNKLLEIAVNDRRDIALVDAAIVAERYIGARALWKPESLCELFVAFAETDGIGLSAIAGLLAPVGRSAPFGRHILFAPAATAPFRLTAPIAPGLIETVGIERIATIPPDTAMVLARAAGSIALDGERELTFDERDQVRITLRERAFRTIDVAACMERAALDGRFVEPVGKRIIPPTLQGGSP